jgi:hypothetical protein
VRHAAHAAAAPAQSTDTETTQTQPVKKLPLQAAIDRIGWLPSIHPGPFSTDLYTLLAVSPLFLWDVVRQRPVQRVYLIWLGLFLPVAVAVNLLWDMPGWHALVPKVLAP